MYIVQVTLQGGALRECFGTQLTLKWSLSSMDSQMLFKVSFPVRLIAANGAGMKRPLFVDQRLCALGSVSTPFSLGCSPTSEGTVLVPLDPSFHLNEHGCMIKAKFGHANP